MKSSFILFGFAGLVAVGLIVFAVMRSKPPSDLDVFAQCLSQSGAKLYTTWWCPHCENQKALFGDAVRYLNIIECAEDVPAGSISQMCKDFGIKSVPQWEFSDGSKQSGEMSLEALSSKTGCVISNN